MKFPNGRTIYVTVVIATLIVIAVLLWFMPPKAGGNSTQWEVATGYFLEAKQGMCAYVEDTALGKIRDELAKKEPNVNEITRLTTQRVKKAQEDCDSLLLELGLVSFQ